MIKAILGFLLNLSPVLKFKVSGNSMSPYVRGGNFMLVDRLAYFLKKPKINQIVVLKKERYIIKRVTKIMNDRYFVLGDNKEESTDSREFGWVEKKDIVGKVIFKI